MFREVCIEIHTFQIRSLNLRKKVHRVWFWWGSERESGSFIYLVTRVNSCRYIHAILENNLNENYLYNNHLILTSVWCLQNSFGGGYNLHDDTLRLDFVENLVFLYHKRTRLILALLYVEIWSR